MIFLITRLILIPLAYVAALLAAGLAAAAISFIRAYPPVAHDAVAVAATSWVIFEDFVIFCIYAGAAGFVPAAIAIVLAEVFALRSALYFCGAALVTGFAASRLIDPVALTSLPSEPAIAGATALTGGFVYWLLAGRGSGLGRKPEPQRS